MPGERCTESLSFNVTKTEKDMVNAMVAHEYRTVSNMMRVIIREAFETRGLKLGAKAEASDE